MFVGINPSAKRLSDIVVAGAGTSFSDSITVPDGTLLGQLGFVLSVSVAGAGTISIIPQTTTSDGADGTSSDWIDCTLSSVYLFDCTALNTSRGQISDMVLDKFRLKIVSTGAAGTLQVLVCGDDTIT